MARRCLIEVRSLAFAVTKTISAACAVSAISDAVTPRGLPDKHASMHVRRRPSVRNLVHALGARPISCSAICIALVCAGCAAHRPKPTAGELMSVVLQSRADDVEKLLKRGADANGGDAAGCPALSLAAAEGVTAIVESLLAHGADPNEGGSCWLPIIAAASRGRWPVVKALLAHGANPEITTGRCNEPDTPLAVAAAAGHLEVAAGLLAAGAMVDARGTCRMNCTPLQCAAMRGRTAMVKLLLDAGAQIESPAGDNWTPLGNAVSTGQLDTVRLLLARGAELRPRDGMPLVQVAERNGDVEVASLLRAAANGHRPAAGEEGPTARSPAPTARLSNTSPAPPRARTNPTPTATASVATATAGPHRDEGDDMVQAVL